MFDLYSEDGEVLLPFISTQEVYFALEKYELKGKGWLNVVLIPSYS